jgi:hypothetical protein
MEFQMDTPGGYRVEVSGWDMKENFFVEKALLEWEGEGKKEVALRNSLREGCVVFVRLLQPVTTGQNFPIAYQTRTVAGRDGNGRTRVGLERLRPRPACKDTIELNVKTTIKVA